ncbi:MAG: hypothetical protein ACKVKF_25990, partial [Rhodobacterales bacterium]
SVGPESISNWISCRGQRHCLSQRNQCRGKSLFKVSSNFIKDDFGQGEIKTGKSTRSQERLGTSRPEVSSVYENIRVEKYCGHVLLLNERIHVSYTQIA